MTLAQDVLDLDELLRRAEPETAQALRALPELDESVGILALQAEGDRLLAEAPSAVLPPEVFLQVEPDGTRVFRPESARPAMGILWIHGGGLVAGHPRQDDLLCAGLAREHGVVVRACRYALAPQSPYPAGLGDCVTALRRAVDELGSVVLAGASAGGGLALATALRARDEGITGVRGVVAYYPMLDDRDVHASMQRFRARRTWHAALNRLAWQAYLPETAGGAHVPLYAAPGRATPAELRGLPSVHLDVGSLDGFLDENLVFAANLARADVEVELTVAPRAWHASDNAAPHARSSRVLAQARSAAFTRMLADG